MKKFAKSDRLYLLYYLSRTVALIIALARFESAIHKDFEIIQGLLTQPCYTTKSSIAIQILFDNYTSTILAVRMCQNTEAKTQAPVQ